MYGYFLNFFTSRRGRSNIEFPGGAQVGMLGYESALPFLSGLVPVAARR